MPAKKSRETASGDADPLEVKIQGGSIATGEAGTPGPGSYHTDELAPKRSKLSSTGSSPGESQMCENGVMRCVVVENFMNHRHLKVDLSPGVNFVVGANGSGKSAIVMALQAGLGCRASASGRNSNTYKNNIMNGCDTAVVKIMIANGGSDPFKYGEFGETIVVERRLDRHGPGAYHLSNDHGGTRRRSNRAEVEELCRHFNIQAANPCAVLTQDHAKKFLHSGNESSLYEFFLEAANLKEIQDDLLATRAALDTMEEQIAAFQLKMPEYEEVAVKAQADFDGAVALRKLDTDRSKFERLLVWSCFNDRERRIEEEECGEAKARDTIITAAEEQRNANDEQSNLEMQLAAAISEKDDLFRQLEDVSKHGKHLKENNGKEKKEVKHAERALQGITDEIEQAQENRAQAQKRLDEQLASLKANQMSQQAQFECERAQLDQEVADLECALKVAEEKSHALKFEHDGGVKEADGLKREVDEADAQCMTATHALKEMNEEGFEAISRLHPKMPELLQLIQANQRTFLHPPVGPLGSFVKMTPGNEQFAKGAEIAMGGPRGLSIFVVQEVQDENKLYQLAHSVGLSHFIRVVRRRPDQRFNVFARHPAISRLNPHLAAFKTVLDVICVCDDTVFNVLIDNFCIETKLLIPTEAEAREALFCKQLNFGATTRERISQISSVVLESGAGFSIKAHGLEERSASSVQPNGVLQSNIQHAKCDLQSELEWHRAQHAIAHQALDALSARVISLACRQVAEKRNIKALNNALREARTKIRQLQSDRQSDPAEEIVNELRGEVTTWNERIAAEQRKEAELTARVEVLRGTLAGKGGDLNEAMKRYTMLTTMYEAKRAEADKLSVPLNNCKHHMRRLEKRLHEAQVVKTAAKTNIKEWKAINERDLPALLEGYGERVNDEQGRTSAELKAEMDHLIRRVQKAEKKHGGKNLFELETQAHLTNAKMMEKKEELTVVTKSREGTQSAFEERYKFWQRSCKHKGKQANLDFNRRLTRKGHAGELRFDHRTQTLSLQVSRNNQDAKSSGTTDARNLSGGERSFTTLAFELSMWEFCETPVRVLDEFDVFMDDTYRKIAVDTLLELCEKQPHRQFIFLTPQDMHPFLKDRKVQPRVIKMNDVR